ncbi:unnamed protein product [Lepidochelys kempii]
MSPRARPGCLGAASSSAGPCQRGVVIFLSFLSGPLLGTSLFNHSGPNSGDFVVSLLITVVFLRAPALRVQRVCVDFSLHSSRQRRMSQSRHPTPRATLLLAPSQLLTSLLSSVPAWRGGDPWLAAAQRNAAVKWLTSCNGRHINFCSTVRRNPVY